MQNIIHICNNKVSNVVLHANPEFSSFLRTSFSYKMEGVEYTQAFKQGWNGISYCIDKKGNFPTGLFDRVASLLKQYEIPFEVKDDRKPIEAKQELNITDKLIAMEKPPRDYQLAMVEAAMNNRKGIIRAATGSGKSVGAALITAKFNRPTIIYVIGIDLLKQFHKLFSALFDEPIGFIGNGVCDIQRINIASIWTVGKSLGVKTKIFDEEDSGEEKSVSAVNKIKIQQLLKKTELHILDECHAVVTNTMKEIHKAIDPSLIYGMSGTPFRSDCPDFLIEGILGSKIVDISASDLIKRRVLAQPLIKFIDVPTKSARGQKYNEVYSSYIVENEDRNNIILEQTKLLVAKGYQVLVLFKQLNHGKILHQMFIDADVHCEFLNGKNKLEEREIVKERMLNKESSVLLASVILDIGVDIPTLSALVLAGSGKSPIRANQRIGRVIRYHPGKTYAAVVDFIDNVKFLKNHSRERYRIYSLEEGFIVKCPPKSKL